MEFLVGHIAFWSLNIISHAAENINSHKIDSDIMSHFLLEKKLSTPFLSKVELMKNYNGKFIKKILEVNMFDSSPYLAISSISSIDLVVCIETRKVEM